MMGRQEAPCLRVGLSAWGRGGWDLGLWVEDGLGFRVGGLGLSVC